MPANLQTQLTPTQNFGISIAKGYGQVPIGVNVTSDNLLAPTVSNILFCYEYPGLDSIPIVTGGVPTVACHWAALRRGK